MKSYPKVCVTGATGYVGSWLVKKLLEKGYTVHATLRNLQDKSKIDFLKSLPNADTNLLPFQADIYSVDDFEPAIRGCEYVFHVATPVQHDPNSSLYKDTVEATVVGARSIVESCIKLKTVKRLIYTASALSASPLNEDGKSFKSCMDESCWTPLNLSFSYGNDTLMNYIEGKKLAEQEILRYNIEDDAQLEVLTLACGLIGGETILSHVPGSVQIICSQITRSFFAYNHGFQFIQQVIGTIPIVHIDDVCEAHIFCMETPSVKGRFLCFVDNPTSRDIAAYFEQHHPEFKIDQEFMGGAGNVVKLDSSKLTNMGFVYKHDLKKILDESLECTRRLGGLVA